MKLGFLVNRLETEKERYTTTLLAMTAANRGHEVYRMDVASLSCNIDAKVTARAVQVASAASVDLIAEKEARDAASNSIDISNLDTLFLRNDPAEDVVSRPWARLAGINFGRLAKQSGVTVVNDPDGLAHAINKMYLHFFPADVRPKSIVTRSKADLLDFATNCGEQIMVKPLHGSGGHNVFYLRLDRPENINQIFETLLEEGHILAQEYLPAAVKGDVRLFVMNGQILERDGKAAAIRRLRAQGDVRSNISVGATVEAASITPSMKKLVDKVAPRLVDDGMFLVGLDIVEDKLLEINVFSPGGMWSANRLHKTNFAQTVIDALEARC
ncbi:glutathione synthase [Ruegeria arenilitoris]|uniref:glutathione synthase n=1 Tax=Ruegeria arenilitoris TaxID=1173585 RepID=UPI00148069F1|nr:glutathione synthase [Ruegeria arenilitoris]